MVTRRNFLGSLLAAPAIVRASSLMAVVPIAAPAGSLTGIRMIDELGADTPFLAGQRIEFPTSTYLCVRSGFGNAAQWEKYPANRRDWIGHPDYRNPGGFANLRNYANQPGMLG